MRPLLLATCKLSACTLHHTQTFLPLGFYATRHQTILGIDSAVTSLCTLCIILRAFERETPLRKSPIVVGLKVLCSLNYREQSCWSDGGEKCLCDGGVDLQTSDVEAIHAPPVLYALVGAMIAGRL
jgi:hypothetical protein